MVESIRLPAISQVEDCTGARPASSRGRSMTVSGILVKHRRIAGSGLGERSVAMAEFDSAQDGLPVCF